MWFHFEILFYFNLCFHELMLLIKQKCHISCVNSRSRVEHIVKKLGEQLFSWII